MTKFNLSIDLFTEDVRDAVFDGLHRIDVARALRNVADRLAKFTALPWNPYALTGTIYSGDGRRRPIGTWNVDSGAANPSWSIDSGAAEHDPDSRVHCSCCSEHLPRTAQGTCDTYTPKEAHP